MFGFIKSYWRSCYEESLRVLRELAFARSAAL